MVLREHVAKAVQRGRDEVYALFWQSVCEELARMEDRAAGTAYDRASRYLAVCDCPTAAWDKRAQEAFTAATALLDKANVRARASAQYRAWACAGQTDGGV